MYCERLFRRPKNILVRDHRFFAAVVSWVGVRNFDAGVAQGFVWTTVKYVVKSSDYLFSMRKGLVKLTSRNDREL